jgi:hypothetical protein
MPPLLAAAVLAALAQPPAPKPALEGAVLNPLTSQPIPNATIQLTLHAAGPPQYRSTLTGPDGHFRITDLHPGEYSATAHKPGFHPTTPRTFVTIPTTQPLQLRLLPQSVVAGRLRNEFGEPLSGVEISLRAFTLLRGLPFFLPAASTRTNDLGDYRLSGLTPGTYYLAAIPESNQTTDLRDGAQVLGYTPLLYPNAREIAAAQPLSLQPGQELTGLNFTLKREPLFHFSVRIPPQHAAGSLTAVELVPQDLRQTPLARLPSSHFEDGLGLITQCCVQAGRYLLRAYSTNPAATATLPLEISSDLDNLELRWNPFPTFTGKFVAEDPSASDIDWSAAHIPLDIYSGQPLPTHATITPKPDGSFTYQPDSPGLAFFNQFSSLPTPGYVAAIRAGGEDYLAKPLDLAATPPGPLRIIVRADPGRLQVRLQPAPSPALEQMVECLLIPVEPALRDHTHILRHLNPANGAFTFTNLRPGDYYILALDLGQGAGLGWRFPLTPVQEKAATRLHIEPNGHHDIQIKLHRPPQ